VFRFAPKSALFAQDRESDTFSQKQTKNTWHRPDPSFTYLLSFFLLITSIAWGLAYADGFSKTLRITLFFIFIHFIALSLLVSAVAYFLIGRLLGPGVPGLPGRRRQGLFTTLGAEGEQLEFGYCFDVSIRAFFPVWLFLYVVQFLLMPVIAKEYWYVLSRQLIFSITTVLILTSFKGITFIWKYTVPGSICLL
jgi:UNC-50 family